MKLANRVHRVQPRPNRVQDTGASTASTASTPVGDAGQARQHTNPQNWLTASTFIDARHQATRTVA